MDQPHLFVLRPIARLATGEPVPALDLRPPGPFVIGRSSQADWCIPDQMVSRRHASLLFRDGQWFLTDLGSRHGTTVNGERLEPHAQVPIVHSDRLSFGAWSCRCQSAAQQGLTSVLDDEPPGRTDISAIDASRLSGIAQRGLEALLALSGELNLADSEAHIASAAVQAVREATGCKRVVVARQTSEREIETLASSTPEPPRLSRSLIEAAASQRDDGLVELRATGDEANQAHSIVELNIRTAICAAIRVGDTPVAFLVLDTRRGESPLPPDASAFCHAVAQLAGLAFHRLHAATLAGRHRQLEQDLGAARRAQQLLLPPPSGKLGAVVYAFESLAGRVVAGDLFDAFPLDEQRIAMFLGDVSGKGVGAAVLMAAAQSQLRTRLLAGHPLADAVAAVSRDLFCRTESSKFVTLIAAVIDAGACAIEIVDAGHGMCILWLADGNPARLEAPNGFPLGIVEHAEYQVHRTHFPLGARIVFFSDGAIEQPGATGAHFGYEAVLMSIARGSSPQTMARALVEDVQAHAGGALADDLTVAAAQLT